MKKQHKIDDNTKCIMILKDHGITSMVSHFSGGGDEGYIDSLNFFNIKKEQQGISKIFNEEDITYIENWMCNIILDHAENEGADIINNDGGTACIYIDLIDMSYTIDIEEYYTEVNNYSSEGELTDAIKKY